MVIFFQKFLVVLGLLKGLGNELTFEVVRHFALQGGENKVNLFDPREALMIG